MKALSATIRAALGGTIALTTAVGLIVLLVGRKAVPIAGATTALTVITARAALGGTIALMIAVGATIVAWVEKAAIQAVLGATTIAQAVETAQAAMVTVRVAVLRIRTIVQATGTAQATMITVQEALRIRTTAPTRTTTQKATKKICNLPKKAVRPLRPAVTISLGCP